MVSKIDINSDYMGALASGLCIIHCIATPILFIAQTCSATKACCVDSPMWWSAIDYIFIVITFFAVYQSGRNSSKNWVKYALMANWTLLTLLIVNQGLELVSISDNYKYAAALGLIGLHIYNLRHCQCADEACCVTE